MSNDGTEAVTVKVHALGVGHWWMGLAEGARHPPEGADTWENVLVEYCLMPFTRRNEAPGISCMH